MADDLENGDDPLSLSKIMDDEASISGGGRC